MFTFMIKKLVASRKIISSLSVLRLQAAWVSLGTVGHELVCLKVHKNENFFGFDFGTIFPRSPRTTRNGKNF